MNLYLISQDEDIRSYDTYDSAVVVARSEAEAAQIHPGGKTVAETVGDDYPTWTKDPAKVKVTYLGKAKAGQLAGVILASFNAG